MTPADLLLRLRDLKVRASVRDGKLCLDPDNAVPDDLRAAVAEHETALIEFVGRMTGAKAAPTRTAIPRAERGGPLPLSFAQQRFWFLGQLGDAGAAYNMTMALRLRGALDVASLEASLTEIVARHEVLRTRIVNEGGDPVQYPLPDHRVPLERRPLPPGEAPEAALQKLAGEELARPFDLTKGEMCAFTLVEIGTDDHALIVTMHHIASDRWSYGGFLGELANSYAARTAGGEADLPELPIQYADYAVWQREWYEREAQGLVDYWRQQLEGAPTLELATDFPRPAQQTFRGAIHDFEIPTATAEALKALGVQEKCTFFMTTLAAFQILLAKHSGQDDIVVGTPVANRDRVETEPLIGLFLNSLVLRGSLAGDPTFRELLQRVRQMSLDAFKHQDMPFEQLVVELKPDRDMSRNPLFQVLFNLMNETGSPKLGDLRVEDVAPDAVTAKFDLTLAIEDGTTCRGAFEYNVDLFEAARIERMTDQFLRLLAAIVANPDARLHELDVRTDEERALVETVNDTKRDYPRDETFYQRFEAQVAAAPDRTAVTCDGHSLTYQDLNARANRFAHLLRDRGAKPDQLIGVALPRGLDLLVALLGIQKAGAAYVPLDPEYPEDRIAFIVEDAGIQLMVRPDDFEGAEGIVRVGDAADRSDQNPEPAAGPSHLAYVIFTSGSTGKPKGVQIEHRALLNFLETMADQPGLTQDDVLCAVTTISFDIAGLELYLPLLKGAKIALATEDQVSDGRALSQLLIDESCTLLQATPATWRLLLEVGFERNNLKALCGGEALPRELAEQLLPVVGELWNMYGPTETTVWSLVQKMASGDGFVPIGAPIANTQVHLLDRQLQPVPIGVPGELYLGGDGLARGYWNRDELTAEKFIAHPVSSEPGARLYHTGDLARWHPDGSLEFLGRIDHQVKVRGFRIELGEIEHVLADHDAVKDCAVVAQRKPTGDQLVASVVLHPGSNATVSELRKHLRASLPDYMVPQGFVMLDELPLTPNGKVDRKALASSGPRQSASRENNPPPVTEMEKFIASVWEDVLEVKDVGLKDNFFDLGGHSLLAMRVVHRVEKHIQQPVFPIELLLQTLDQFAELCDQRLGRRQGNTETVTADPTPASPEPAGDKRGGLLGRLRSKLGRGR